MNSPGTSEPNAAWTSLDQLRTNLLVLHKALLETERISYEAAFGAVHSPYTMLKLALEDPWFAWLLPLSSLIARIDATLEEPPPLHPAQWTTFSAEVRSLLVASEDGDGFPRSYFEALQREPDVILAHAAVIRVLPPPAGRSPATS